MMITKGKKKVKWNFIYDFFSYRITPLVINPLTSFRNAHFHFYSIMKKIFSKHKNISGSEN